MQRFFDFPFLESDVAQIPIIAATGDIAWHGHPKTTVAKSHDNQFGVIQDSCYVTDKNRDGEAHYTIEPSTVTSVKLLNRFDCCS